MVINNKYINGSIILFNISTLILFVLNLIYENLDLSIFYIASCIFILLANLSYVFYLAKKLSSYGITRKGWSKMKINFFHKFYRLGICAAVVSSFSLIIMAYSFLYKDTIYSLSFKVSLLIFSITFEIVAQSILYKIYQKNVEEVKLNINSNNKK